MQMNGRPNRPLQVILLSTVATSLVISTAATLGAQAPAGPPAMQKFQRTLVEVIERTEPAVVSIARVQNSERDLPSQNFDPFRNGLRNRSFRGDPTDPESPDFVPNEFGTGVLLAAPREDRKPVILTNYHVVRGGPPLGTDPQDSESRLYVRFADRRGFEAYILAADPRSDLAALQIDPSAAEYDPSRITPLPLGDASGLRKGEIVLTLGNPYAIARDGSASAGWGIISNIARRPLPVMEESDGDGASREETIHHLGTLLQVDARLNLGTSGGALVNLDGELVGLITALAALEGYEKSAGYAIPLNDAIRRIIDSLMRGHEVEYGFLGVEPQNVLPDEFSRRTTGLDQTSASLVRRVFPNSPADLGGLKSGDMILSVNGEPTYDRYDLMREISKLGPGAEARIRVWRGRAVQTLTVTLGKWPVSEEEGIIATNPRYPAWRGLRVDYPTARARFLQRPIRRFPAAVAVLEVAPESPAQEAGLQRGDFITHVGQTPVQTPKEFHQAVQGRHGDLALQLFDGRRLTLSE